MKTILVPIDFSLVTRPVVAEAAALARTAKARLVLLHVIQPPSGVADFGPLGTYVLPEMESMARVADAQLAKWEHSLATRGISVATVRTSGISPSKIIAEEARSRSASYIVIGSHGHTAFYDLLIGSTTGGVLKRASCPVIVIPARALAKANVPGPVAHALHAH